MNRDMPSPAVPPGPETPPASLTMVRVKRRSTAQANRKRGDLTDQLDGLKSETVKPEIAALFAKPGAARPIAAAPSPVPVPEPELETPALFAERTPKQKPSNEMPAAEPMPVLLAADEPELPLFAEREQIPFTDEPTVFLPALGGAVPPALAEPEEGSDFPALEAMPAQEPEPEFDDATTAAIEEATPSSNEPEATPAVAQTHSTPFLAGLKVLRNFIKASARTGARAPEPAVSEEPPETPPSVAAEAASAAAPAASEPETGAFPPEPEFSLETPSLEPDLFLLPESAPLPEPELETELEPESEPEATAPFFSFPEESKRRITAEHFGNGGMPVEDSAAEVEDSAEIVPLMDIRTADHTVIAPQVEAPAATEEESANPADAIIDYWDSLRGGRDFPSIDQIDRALIAESWPNSVLLSFPAAQPDMPRISRLGEPNGEVEYNAMVTEWILSRGRHSAKRGRPMEEEQRFPVENGSARYRLLLLPFSSNGAKSDHVLCHVSRTEELSTVATFKRWLAL